MFSRRHVKGQSIYNAKLSRSEVALATKVAATSLGLNPAHFSTYSWKKGSISNLLVNGEKDEVLRRLGDHAVDSSSTFLYQHASGRESRPLLFASIGEGLTVRDISLVCPIVELSYDNLLTNSSALPLADLFPSNASLPFPDSVSAILSSDSGFDSN